MCITDNKSLNDDLYLMELKNEYEERFIDALIHVIIRYCKENKCQLSKMQGIISQYLKQHDLIENENNAGAVFKKYKSINGIDALHRIIGIIDILNSGYYVILLEDSSTKTIFHVGIGIGSNICDYEHYDDNRNYRVDRKLKNKIREIHDNDHEVKYKIADTCLSEKEALTLQRLLMKEHGLQNNYSLIRSHFSKAINFFNKISMRFINTIRFTRSVYIPHFKEPQCYSDIEIEQIIEEILFDFDEYLRNNIIIPAYDSYENRYKMDDYFS